MEDRKEIKTVWDSLDKNPFITLFAIFMVLRFTMNTVCYVINKCLKNCNEKEEL